MTDHLAWHRAAHVVTACDWLGNRRAVCRAPAPGGVA